MQQLDSEVNVSAMMLLCFDDDTDSHFLGRILSAAGDDDSIEDFRTNQAHCCFLGLRTM